MSKKPKRNAERVMGSFGALGEGGYYTNHASAMTGEGPCSKSDIAAELAFRDAEIDRLKARVDQLASIEPASDELSGAIHDFPGWADDFIEHKGIMKDILNYLEGTIFSNGLYVWKKTSHKGDQMLLDIEIHGWGALKHKFATYEEARAFQDRVGDFIAEAIQEKVTRMKSDTEGP